MHPIFRSESGLHQVGPRVPLHHRPARQDRGVCADRHDGHGHLIPAAGKGVKSFSALKLLFTNPFVDVGWAGGEYHPVEDVLRSGTYTAFCRIGNIPTWALDLECVWGFPVFHNLRAGTDECGRCPSTIKQSSNYLAWLAARENHDLRIPLHRWLGCDALATPSTESCPRIHFNALGPWDLRIPSTKRWPEETPL